MKKLLADLPPAPVQDRRTRLMLCALNINMSLEVIRLAEKYGARVVTDDFTHNARYGSEEIEIDGDVFKSLAQGYLRKIPLPGMYSFEQRAEKHQGFDGEIQGRGFDLSHPALLRRLCHGVFGI